MSVHSTTENRRYTALNWAQCASEQNVKGAKEVVFYLEWREQLEPMGSGFTTLAIENGATAPSAPEIGSNAHDM